MTDVQRDEATAFAPATVANVAVGFDLLGFSFPELGDRVRVRRVQGGAGHIDLVSAAGVTTVPADPLRNTATVALRSLIDAQPVPFGLSVEVEKGIPLASGLGGSAASAVAAVVAAAAVWDAPLSMEELCRHALAGEASVSGGVHPDNVVPSLYGGLTASLPGDPVEVLSLPVPDGLRCVVVHPHLELETQAARSVLAAEVPLALYVRQSGWLSGFLHACHTGDLELIGRCLRDDVIEPQRSPAIPGFDAVQHAAMEHGALGSSLAGSGSSVFAWTREADAEAVADAMSEAFAAAGLPTDRWIGPVGGAGARVLQAGDAR